MVPEVTKLQLTITKLADRRSDFHVSDDAAKSNTVSAG